MTQVVDEDLLTTSTVPLGGTVAGGHRGAAPMALRAHGLETASSLARPGEIGGFLRDCCEEGPGLQVASGELWHSYQVWCEREGERPLTRTALGRRLTQRGFSVDRIRRKGVLLRIWEGLGLSIESSC